MRTVSQLFYPLYIMLTIPYSPWAMYGWAPLAIMGEEINKLESAANTQTAYTTITQDGEETELSRPGSPDLSHDDNNLVEGQGDSV